MEVAAQSLPVIGAWCPDQEADGLQGTPATSGVENLRPKRPGLPPTCVQPPWAAAESS